MRFASLVGEPALLGEARDTGATLDCSIAEVDDNDRLSGFEGDPDTRAAGTGTFLGVPYTAVGTRLGSLGPGKSSSVEMGEPLLCGGELSAEGRFDSIRRFF
ncbi:hypothetical protein NMY22_g15408 [Coprinellus aureogranulatus]|nr:hypothetical protein NMY22_g15408 [Coprinellus aureogranulatus]